MQGRWGSGKLAGYVVGAVVVVVGAALLVCESFVTDPQLAYGLEQSLIAIVICATAGTSAGLALRATGAEGRLWLLSAAAFASVFVSQVYWTWSVMARGMMPEPLSISNVFDLMAVGFFVALVVALIPGQGRRLTVWRWAVDATGVLLIAVVLIYVFVIAPWFHDAGDTVWAAVIGSVYAAFGVVLFPATITHFFGPKLRLWRVWEHLLTWGLVAFAAGMILWPAQRAALVQGSSWGSGLVDLMWGAGMLLVFAAAVYRLDSDERWMVGPAGAARSGGGYVSNLVISLVFTSTILALGFQAVRGGSAAVGAETLLSLAAGVSLLFAVRSLLAAMEARERLAYAGVDSATGAGDYRRYGEVLADTVAHAARYGSVMSLAVINVDHFDRFRDVHGLDESIALLREVAAQATQSCESAGAVFRVSIGGFALVLENRSAAQASRIVADIGEGLDHRYAAGDTRLTLSAGISEFPKDAGDAKELGSHAAAALRWAEVNGGNRVVEYDETVATSGMLLECGRGMGQRSQECLNTIAIVTDARYEGTVDHSIRTAGLAVMVARELGLDDVCIRSLEQAALLHDLGMVVVSDSTIATAGPLSDRQWENIYEHPALGERMIAAAGLEDVARIVRSHHEHWDGSGYPDGLRKGDIPIESRILALCEAFDAMTSPRPYRAALSVSAALQQIDLGMGIQFDPMVAETFIRAISRDDLLGPGLKQVVTGVGL